MDNFYHQCPAMMSDGRIFSENKTATRRNEYIKYVNGIYGNDQYRVFLQDNGKKMQDNVWEYYKTNDNCRTTPCIHKYGTRTTPANMNREMQAFNKLGENNFKTDTNGCPKYKDYRLN